MRVPVPSAVVGIVIALCAVLLLKWLSVVALCAWALTVLVRGLWRRHRAGRARAAVVDVEPAPDAEPDCSWCGLPGGHHDLRGRPVRPRHAHQRGALARS
jgi:hypothetical protein